jgi:hypothetical protein
VTTAEPVPSFERDDAHLHCASCESGGRYRRANYREDAAFDSHSDLRESARTVNFGTNYSRKTTMIRSRFLNLAGRRNFRIGPLLALVLGIGVLGACQTQQQIVTQREDNLAAAGFIVRPANTPERQEMLNRLPPHRFVRRVKGDVVHYVYADPLVCGCLYVGTQAAYDQYKLHEQQQHLADEQQMTAQDYSDAAWRWNAWGPWGPVGPAGFVYGTEIGW